MTTALSKNMEIGSNVDSSTHIIHSTEKSNVEPIIVDGENVAMYCTCNKKPSIENILITIKTLRELGWKPIVVVSASFWRRIDDQKTFEESVKAGVIKPAPARKHDDLYILKIARRLKTPVVTNDKLTDFLPEYKDVIDRRVTFMIVEGEFITTDL